MGRELKRVPLDFKWPIGEIWIGYLNPYRCHECKSCGGSGVNAAMNKIKDEWYGWGNPNWVDISPTRRYNANAHQYNITPVEVEALVKAGRLGDLVGNVRFDEKKNHWVEWGKNGKVVPAPEMPTPDQVNEWAKVGFGHDGLNQHICLWARAKELGVEGNCEICYGEGVLFQSDKIKRLHNRWKKIEPPAGDGFQMWETTSEGSPKTPVFNTLEELCEYCASNCSTFASFTATKEEWMAMLDDGFVYHKEGNFIMM